MCRQNRERHQILFEFDELARKCFHLLFLSQTQFQNIRMAVLKHVVEQTKPRYGSVDSILTSLSLKKVCCVCVCVCVCVFKQKLKTIRKKKYAMHNKQ